MREVAVWLMMLAVVGAGAQDRPAAPPAQGEPYTLTLGTNLVVVDVTVRDKHGRPVTGLKQSDFELRESGKAQEIKRFEEHTAADQAGAKVSKIQLPPGDFTNLVRTPEGASLNVILIDRLNTALSDQAFLTDQLMQYAKQAPAGVETAVFGLTDKLVLLQGFSSDAGMLLATLRAAQNPTHPSLREAVPGQSGATSLTVDSRMMEEIAFLSPYQASQIKAFEAQSMSDLNLDRAMMTLQALHQLGRVLANIPGRKNLIWLSGEFPAQFFPGDDDAKLPYTQFAGLQDEFEDTINLLTRSRVVVFPVDAQGLRTSSFDNAAYSNPSYAQRDNSAGYVSDENTESQTRAGEHLAMGKMADDTGGTAYFNTNDLTRVTQEAVTDGADFYTLTYSPAEQTEGNGIYRRISVKVDGKQYRLSYRRGYYVKPRLNPDKTLLASATQAKEPMSSLQRALMPGSPEPRQIAMRIHVGPATAGEEDSVAVGNQPNATKMHKPFKKYQVIFAASPRDVTFVHGGDKLYHATLDFVTCIYDSAGTLVNVQSSTIQTNYDAQGMREIWARGIPFEQRISVPAQGEYFLRAAVRDATTSAVGAIELPVARVAALAPPAAALQVHPTPWTTDWGLEGGEFFLDGGEPLVAGVGIHGVDGGDGAGVGLAGKVFVAGCGFGVA